MTKILKSKALYVGLVVSVSAIGQTPMEEANGDPPMEEASNEPQMEEASDETLMEDASGEPPVEEASDETLMEDASGESPVEEASSEPPMEDNFQNCFLAGTKITMPNGTLKAIEDVKVGEQVLSYDEMLKSNVISEVISLHSPQSVYYYIIEFDDDSQLEVTGNHPIYTSMGWASIEPEKTHNPAIEIKSKLNVGDDVLKVDNNYRKIIGIMRVDETVRTYNLHHVKDTHTFYAGGSLVHNKCVLKGTYLESICGRIRIEDIQVGHRVYGVDIDGNNVLTSVLAKYEKKMLDGIRGKVLNGGLIVTDNHKIRHDNRVAQAKDTPYQDIIIHDKVYDIRTELGNYVSEGIISYN